MSSSTILITETEDDPWAHVPEVEEGFIYEYDEFPDDLTEYPETEPF